ncbi:hypothetical protein FF38_04091 [Lucilia cuprina]|uniref:Uncharacterized protein n=1 Tax=Lucilia cuprina TaxID=7375 RepID=A0A0L0BRW5_LUCCU|nr:hypothetical protein FF38_04091 [Lucilia cuprina]
MDTFCLILFEGHFKLITKLGKQKNLVTGLDIVIASALAVAVLVVETEDPEFTDVIDNITVPAGRNIKLACSVKNLGSYKKCKCICLNGGMGVVLKGIVVLLLCNF